VHGRVRSLTGHTATPLTDGWELAPCAPDAVAGPDALAGASLGWVPASVPSTAASALRSAGAWSLDGTARRFDAEDWWYRTRFSADPAAKGEQLWLCFDGLATVADVWLNGRPLFSSEGMFTAHERRVDEVLRKGGDNELAIRFRALDALLKARRPRPRWRAPMVEHQQLRWFRTTLLGRTPGWSPPAAPVGPWRGIRLERRGGVMVDDVRLRADADGQLDVACRVTGPSRAALGAEIVLERGEREFRAPLAPSRPDGAMTGRLTVPDVQRWWPHTHGEPALYAARLEVKGKSGAVTADLGMLGFRSVTLDTADDDFAIRVNGAPVFCRGACWTPLDVVSLAAAPDALDQAFSQVVDAGMNMLRVPGMMTYESDAFLDTCDARGVLLWQDFMFANMDYPEDPAFLEVVSEEARQQLARLQGRPSVAVLCGNSEVEQQAAMWAAPRERWRPALFHDRLAALAREACPGVPYWPSSTHGGAFPHQGSAGSASYYGVGAYLRPLEDARRAEVRFASECLAFANVPEPATLALMPDGPASRVHHASWKARAPRDRGAGWDFDDVRDHYVAALYRVDPLRLRYADHDRYLAVGRVAMGEVMAAVFGEWRRRRSPTRGGLIWFLRDLWPGAGWGVIDAVGTPKAAWHYLRRALAPVAVSMSDEGGNGLAVHVVNDRPAPLSGELELALYRAGEVHAGRGVQAVSVGPNSAIELNAASLFEGFLDLSYAYRFGPPSHDVIAATLRDSAGTPLAQAFHFDVGLPNTREFDVGLSADMRPRADGAYDLTVRTRRFAQSVCVDVEGFACSDNYFHLVPGGERRLVLRRTGGGDAAPLPRGTLHALNAEASVILAVAP